MLKRCGMFITGIIFDALGTSLITETELGISPIASLAFVLTFIFPHSLGVFIMMINSVVFVIQVVLLGRSFRKIQPPQLLAALLLSVCIDGRLRLLSYQQTGGYMGKILMLLLGCAFLGLRIALEIILNVLVLPGEDLVRVIAGLTGWGLDYIKTDFDTSIVASVVMVSVLIKGQVPGVREDTVIAALIMGNISHFSIEKVSVALAGWIPGYSEITDAMTS